MNAVSASAPGKVILFGEHAVVYGQPALAVPVSDIVVEVTITDGAPGSGMRFDSLTLNESFFAASRPDSPLSRMAHITLDSLGQTEPDAVVTIQSTIPVAGGLGSGAAVSTALGRALAKYVNRSLDVGALSRLVLEVEKVHHGSPSGIDNTVICYAQPVFFVRGREPEILHVGRDFHLVVGDTGIASSTKQMVEIVRSAWSGAPAKFDAIFDAIGAIARTARAAIGEGKIVKLGGLMQENQDFLRQLRVSTPELENLISAARQAGAWGAKLSGGGGGGNMIAVAAEAKIDDISTALISAGAVQVFRTTVQANPT